MNKMGRIEETWEKYCKLMSKITPEPPLSNKEGRVVRLGKDWVALDITVFPYRFEKALRELAGEDTAADCMYRVGEEYGSEVINRYNKKVNDMELALKLTVASSNYFGWSVTDIEELGPQGAKAVFYNSYESRSYFANNKEKSIEPVCHFMAGVIAGIYAVYIGKPCECKETKCVAKGDEYCEFVATVI
ncbi:MAG TPA: hypothetical protein HA348_03085 [Thermoplasmata archaeon]|nr:hypothetical protein [Thermoplasmata archaeon]